MGRSDGERLQRLEWHETILRSALLDHHVSSIRNSVAEERLE
jgi:hypothetical protein